MQAITGSRPVAVKPFLVAAAFMAALVCPGGPLARADAAADQSTVETLLDWARIMKGRSRGKLLDAVVARVAADARTGHAKANARTWRSVDKAVRDMARSTDARDCLFVGRIRLLTASAYIVDGGTENIDKAVTILKSVARDPASPDVIVDRAKALHAVAIFLRPGDLDPLRSRNRLMWRVDQSGLLEAVRQLYSRTGLVAGVSLLRATRKGLARLLPAKPGGPGRPEDRKPPEPPSRLRQEAEGVTASAVDSFLAAMEAIIVSEGLTAKQLARHQESIRRYRIPPLVSRSYRRALDTKVGRVAADSAFDLWVRTPHSRVLARQVGRSLELLGTSKLNVDLYYETMIGAWRTDRLHRTGRLDEESKPLAAHLAPHRIQLDQLRIASADIVEAGKTPVELYIKALLDLYGPERSPAAMAALRKLEWDPKSPTQRALQRAVEYHILRHNLRAADRTARFWHERHQRALALHKAAAEGDDPDARCAAVYKRLSEDMTGRLAKHVRQRVKPPIGKEKIRLAAEYAWVLSADALMSVLEAAVTQERLLGDPSARLGLLKLCHRMNKVEAGRADAIKKMLADVPQEFADRVAYYYRSARFDRCREAVERERARAKKIAPDMLMLAAAAKLQEEWDDAPSAPALAHQVAAWILRVKPAAKSPYTHLRDLSGLSGGTHDRRDMLVALLYLGRQKRPAGDAERIVAACDRARRNADKATSGPARAKPLERLIGRESEIAGRLQGLLRIRLAGDLDGPERATAMKAAAQGILPDPDSKKGRVFYGDGLAERLPPVVRSELADAAYEGRCWARAAVVYELDLPSLAGRQKLKPEDVETYRRWLQCRVHARAGGDVRRMPGLLRAAARRTRRLVAGKEFQGVVSPARRAAAALIWDDAPAAAKAPPAAKLYRRMIARTAEVRLGGDGGNFNEWAPLRRNPGLNRYASLWCFAVIWPNTSGYRLTWAYRGPKWPGGLQQWVVKTAKGRPEPLAAFDRLVDSWCDKAARTAGAGPSARDIRAEAYLMRYLLHRDRACLQRAVSTFAFGNPEYSLAVQLAGRSSRRPR